MLTNAQPLQSLVDRAQRHEAFSIAEHVSRPSPKILRRIAPDVLEVLSGFKPTWRALIFFARLDPQRQRTLALRLSERRSRSQQPDELIEDGVAGELDVESREVLSMVETQAEVKPTVGNDLAHLAPGAANDELAIVAIEAFTRRLMGVRPIVRYLRVAHPEDFQLFEAIASQRIGAG